MNFISKLLLLGLLAWSGTVSQAGSLGTPTAYFGRVIDFDESSWSGLLQSGPRPAAYLFTTSYCSTCPDAFAKVRAGAAKRGLKVPLAVVMMDVSANQALRHALHFDGLTQLYAFDGFEPAIRQSVDPAWPNVTPYVVLVDKRGRLQKFIGPPTPRALRAWLG